MMLVIEHIPIAKARPRFANGRVYDPQSREKIKAKFELASQMRDKRILRYQGCDISFYLTAHMPKPKSWSKTRLKSVEGKSAGGKKDCDNIAKFYLDVLNGIAYDDDRQVSCLWCQKVYSDNPRVEIQINSIEESGITDPRIAQQ